MEGWMDGFPVQSSLFHDSNTASFHVDMQKLATSQVCKTPTEFTNLKAFNPYQKNKQKRVQAFFRFSLKYQIAPDGLRGVRVRGQ
jgi:hypothetical protein